MLLFGVLFIIAGLFSIISPILPANRTKTPVEKLVLVLIGIFFIYSGTAKIIGAENTPITTSILLVLLITVVLLFGYNRLTSSSA